MKNLIVVDIDGTLANIDHRLHFIKERSDADSPEKDASLWDAFFEACDRDEPIFDVIAVVDALREVFNPRTGKSLYKIVFVTGRSESIRGKTCIWLKHYLGADLSVMSDDLLMRKEGDHRPDHIVKLEVFRKYGYKFEDVICVFEDRNAVVEAWRKKGVTVLQSADGDF